jgi:EAL domain-containing protein (putative c-di-GMP-specific phosphodiesterase class I)
VEALVRWNHPDRGLLWPPDFLPQAELGDVMGDIDTQVLEGALGQQRRWSEEGLELAVAVNMSGACLTRWFPREVERQLRVSGVAPGNLMLELTEGALMANPVVATEVMGSLSRMGVKLSIDDFGTGYSSLARLAALPFDQVKIDKSFLRGDDQGTLRVVRAITNLSHDLGRSVVLEGVERETTWRQAIDLECDFAQGYGICPPLDPRTLAAPLARLAREPSGLRFP